MDPSVSDNYRAIIIALALVWGILLTHKEHFKTSELQFGFKQNMSTSLCTSVLKNVSRYMHEGSIFAFFLDASKVFDFINHSILFSGLLSKGLPAHLVRFFLGVCLLGGVLLSLTVFVKGVFCLQSCYIDDLLMDLKEQFLGQFLSRCPLLC